MHITEDDLSPYSKAANFALQGTDSYRAKKLTATFRPRKNYVCHFSNLQFYLEQGLILTKIHKVLSFTQTKFLKNYIDYCTQKRAESKSTYAKNLWKNCCNSVYGKTIQQDRNRIDMHLVTNELDITRLISSPRFESFRIINENLTAVYLRQRKVQMNKLWAVGFTILEISKLHMFKTFYNVLQPHFGEDNIQIGFSDTDSILALVKTESLDRDITALKNYFDLSNYPTTHNLYNTEHKSIAGYFKNEMEGVKKITEFVGLKSKTYAMKTENILTAEVSSVSKCKGVAKNKRKQIPFSAFVACIENITRTRTAVRSLKITNQTIRLKELKKTCFTSFDDKRYLFSCGIHSTGYGSTLIHQANNYCPFCPNADTFYTNEEFEEIVNV